MLDKTKDLPPVAKEQTLDDVRRVAINRFIFVMKAINENHLWSELEDYLESQGCVDLLVSGEPIALMKTFIKQKVAAGEDINKRGHRVMNSISCFGGHPTPPPKVPAGGGDGGLPK